MREFHWSEEKILNGGYYKAQRYWSILCESKANDLHELSVVIAMPHYSEADRANTLDHLKKRQPRRHPQEKEEIPQVILDKFMTNWNEVERKQKLAQRANGRRDSETNN